MTTTQTPRESSLVSLALTMGLSPAETVVLPVLIESAAKSQNMSESRLLWTAHNVAEVRDYLASVCRRVAAEGV